MRIYCYVNELVGSMQFTSIDIFALQEAAR